MPTARARPPSVGGSSSRVVRIPAAPGQSVPAGASLVVLEAMKMENELRAPAAVVVRTVLVEPGQTVEKGQVLIELE